LPILIIWLPFGLVACVIASVYMVSYHVYDADIVRAIFLYPVSVLEILLARFGPN
jgi:hypothetical protein